MYRNYSKIDGYQENDWEYQVFDFASLTWLFGCICILQCFQDYEKDFQDFFDFEGALGLFADEEAEIVRL